jgi:hypothetical protein
MIVAAALAGNDIAPVLDFADEVLAVACRAGAPGESSRSDLPHGLLSLRAAALEAIGADVVLCGAVSNELAALLWHRGIAVLPRVHGPADEAVRVLLEDYPGRRVRGDGWRGCCRRRHMRRRARRPCSADNDTPCGRNSETDR